MKKLWRSLVNVFEEVGMKLNTKLIGLIFISLSVLGVLSVISSVVTLKSQGDEEVRSTRSFLMKEKKEQYQSH